MENNNTLLAAPANPKSPNSITFRLGEEDIIVIDEKGFHYKGELIEDAGEVYNLFKQFLKTTKVEEL